MNVELDTKIPSVMDDPRERSVAKVYAIAYLDAAGSNAGAAAEELGSFIDDVVAKNPQFAELLFGAALGRDEKLQLIENVVTNRGTPLFVNFLKVLARHERLSLLPSVRKVVDQEVERRSGRRRVRVTSAVELTPSAAESIRERLRQALQGEPILETHVDSTLIGGLVIRVGDTVYDGSVKTQIKQLRARLRERCLNEIQRGRDRFSHPEGN